MGMARHTGLLKSGLTILNAASLCTIAVASVLYAQRDAPEIFPAAEEVEIAAPRLPRARPEEPVITGSIARELRAPAAARSSSSPRRASAQHSAERNPSNSSIAG